MLESEDEIMARDKSARAIAEAAYSAGYTAGLWRAAQIAEDGEHADNDDLARSLRAEGVRHA